MSMTTTTGGVIITMDEEGKMSLEIATIKRVDIEGISNLRNHQIVRDDDGIAHEVEFGNGGAFKLSYTGAGKLRHFEGKRVTINITPENVIILRQEPGDPATA